ncbi:hypothetical protein OUZ56_004855 [Daphnia magna]|uniref:Uncharacterized protein n=1 Tax=Daphnia magna TaxID=35525 RepID=A0ABQ9YRE7_9CRUS|nr:hypothetical protein OUZ56_004855 [Daphnia magna]
MDTRLDLKKKDTKQISLQLTTIAFTQKRTRVSSRRKRPACAYAEPHRIHLSLVGDSNMADKS